MTLYCIALYCIRNDGEDYILFIFQALPVQILLTLNVFKERDTVGCRCLNPALLFGVWGLMFHIWNIITWVISLLLFSHHSNSMLSILVFFCKDCYISSEYTISCLALKDTVLLHNDAAATELYKSLIHYKYNFELWGAFWGWVIRGRRVPPNLTTTVCLP